VGAQRNTIFDNWSLGEGTLSFNLAYPLEKPKQQHIKGNPFTFASGPVGLYKFYRVLPAVIN
jgi:hypothetical protein